MLIDQHCRSTRIIEGSDTDHGILLESGPSCIVY
jgi:hypothetical protein